MEELRNLIATIVIIIVVMMGGELLFGEESMNNPWDYAKITEVDYRAKVVDEPGSEGKVVVTERLTFDIHAALKSNLFWELWRDLPEAYIDGVKVDYKVNSVKQIIEDEVTETERIMSRMFDTDTSGFGESREIRYSESPRLYWEDEDYTRGYAGLGPQKWYHSKGPYDEGNRQYECVFFYVDGLYREKVVFEIEYEMYNAALRYGDCSELYLTPYSEKTINDLESFSGQILFPKDKMPSEENYEVHTYGTNAGAFSVTGPTIITPGYQTFYFNLDKSQLKFKPYNEYIEFSLIAHGDDKHIFTQHASVNDYYNDDVLEELRTEQKKYESLPKKFNFIKTIIVVVCSVLTLLMAGIVWGTDRRVKKKYTFYNPISQMEYFRDIPSDLDPNFAAILVFCKNKAAYNIQDGYSAVMLNLVRKGYIDLDKIQSEKGWESENVKVTIKNRPRMPQEILEQQQADINQRREMLNQQQMVLNQQQETLNQGQEGFTHTQPLDEIKQQQEMLNRQQEVLNSEHSRPMLEQLTLTEEQYFDLLLRHAPKGEIAISEFQRHVSADYEYTSSFVKEIKRAIVNIGTTQSYFQKADYKAPRKRIIGQAIAIAILGIIILSVGNIISYQTRLELAFGAFFILGMGLIMGAFYLYKSSQKHILLTQFGEDEYAKWRGLYNFLDSMTLLNERTVIDLVVWEKYLVYATAFGISEKVIKAIGIRCQEASESPVLSNRYYRSHGFRSSGRAFRMATRTATFTARSGGHGGYGGGGRGGGGGGGGH